METQNRWGVVALGTGFMVLALAVAVGTYFYERGGNLGILSIGSRTEAPANADEDNDGLKTWEESLWGSDPWNPDTDSDGVFDGDEVTAGSSPTLVGTSTAFARFAPSGDTINTNKITDDLYAALETDGASFTESQREERVRAIIESDIVVPDIEEKLTLDALTIKDVPLENYTALLIVVLRTSTLVKQYELDVFSRAITNKNYFGSPELKQAAEVYRAIASALLVMETPPAIAREHLAVVNSMGSLANIINRMSVWSGDPLTGMVYIDLFVGAEAKTDDALDVLFARLNSLLSS